MKYSVLLAALLVACLPSQEETPWLVESERIIAVRGVPAEVRPGEPVSFEALVASPDDGSVTPPRWSLCLSPRTAEERTGVSASCTRGEEIEPTGQTAPMLTDACARFGPNPPPSSDGEPPRRPADPDPTGGYFVPVRAETDATVAFGFERIRCDLAGATRDVFEEYQARYTLNQHPEIEQVAVRAFGNETTLGAAVPTIPGGTRLELVIRALASAPEPYVVYMPEVNTLDDRVEALTVHIYVTGGTLTRAVLPIEDGAASTSWVLPSGTTTSIRGWVILSDDRGGSSWLAFAIEVP